MSLKNKTVNGVIWAVSQEASVQLINFGVQLLLVRLLMPSDFGLLAMLNIFVAVGNMLIDGGLTSSLIRTVDIDDEDYSTVFYINLLGSVLIYLVLFFCAPLIADFYNQNILILVIRIYMVTFIIRAFMAVQVTRLIKEMNFKKQMIIQLPSVVFGGLVGIVLAVLDFGLWSLVWMSIAQVSLVTLLYWIKSGWLPKFVFNKRKIKYHFNFGYKLTLEGLISILYQNVYSVLIGRYFTVSQLGYYNQANTLRMFPVKQLTKALSKVTYPMFSSISDNNLKLKSIYSKVMGQVLYWVAPLMIFLFLIARPLFEVLFTEKWLPAVYFFQILCIPAIIYPLTVYNINILKVKGRSDLILKISTVKFGVLFLGVFIALQFGLIPLVYFSGVATFFSFFLNAYYCGKMIDYSLVDQLKDIYKLFLFGFAVGFICWFSTYFFITNFNNWSIIAITGILFFSLYFVMSYLLKISAFREFIVIVEGLLKKYKK